MLFKKRLFWLLFLVVSFLASYYVVNSNVVLQWVINKVSMQLTGIIEIENIQGGVIGPVTLENVRFTTNDLRVNASQIKIDWNPVSLLFDSIEVTTLDVTDVEIFLSDNIDFMKKNNKYLDQVDFRKILPINITSGAMRNISINKNIQNKGEIKYIDEIKFSAKKRNENIIISKLDLITPDYSFNATGKISSLQKLSVDGVVKWDWHKPDLQNNVGYAKLQGNSTLLNIEIRLKKPEIIQFDGVVENLYDGFTWNGILIANNVDSTKYLSNKYSKLKFIGLINSEFKLQGELNNLKINQAVISQVNSNAKLQVQGKIALSETPLSFVGQSEWYNIQWTLPGDNSKLNTNGRFTGKISETNYELIFNKTELQYNGMIFDDFSAVATGNYTTFDLKNISGSLFGGNVSGEAEFNLESGLHWKSKLAINHINPSTVNLKQLSAWPGDVSFKLVSRGNITKDNIKAQIKIKEAGGLLREKQFSAFADFNISNNYYLVNKMQVVLGDSKINGSGSIGNNWNLNWNANRVDLGLIDNKISGVVSGSGSIKGARHSPIIKINMSASEINSNDQQRIDKLTLNLNIDLSDDKSSLINIKAENIEYNNIQLDKLAIRADGKKINHKVSITAFMNEEKLKLGFQGAINNKNKEWQGKITSGNIVSELVGDWRLSRKGGIIVSKNRVELPDLCWRNKKSSLCFDAQWRNTEKLDAKLKFDDVPLSLFQGMVKKQFKLGGVIQGDAEIHAMGSKIHDARVTVNINQGYVDMVLNEDVTRLSSFEYAKFNYKQKINIISSNLNLQFEEQENLTAKITLKALNKTSSIKNWP
jgi:hypothetical protein